MANGVNTQSISIMLCDADTHFVPFSVFEQMDPALLARKLYHCGPRSTDPVWHQHYEAIRDPDWPDCDRVQDFAELPLDIRQEIKSQHSADHVYIDPDLQFVFVTDLADPWPSLDDIATAGRLVLKTDCQVLNPSGMENLFSYHGHRDLALEFTRIYNDHMADLCLSNQRFHSPMWLPLQHLDQAMHELQRLSGKNFFGVRLLDHHPWAYVTHLMPVWTECARLRLPIYLHVGPVGTFREDMPFHWHVDYQDHTYGLLMERWPTPRFPGKSHQWLVGIMSWIHTGVLDRLPDLRIVSTENGISWIPMVRQWCLEQGLRDPLPYFKRNFWFTVEPEESQFLEIAQMIGWDRLLYATDWPHDDTFGHNRMQDLAFMRRFVATGDLSSAHFALISHANYMTLLERSDA